jgi:hypothetical protein
MPVGVGWQPGPCTRKCERNQAGSAGVDGIASPGRAYYLTRKGIWVNCVFAMAASVQFVQGETLTEFEFPQREAAFFYGLFLRGHSADKLRQDIEVPAAVLAKWHREAEREPGLRDILSRVVAYRRHVLAIFDTLVGSEKTVQRVQ